MYEDVKKYVNVERELKSLSKAMTTKLLDSLRFVRNRDFGDKKYLCGQMS